RYPSEVVNRRQTSATGALINPSVTWGSAPQDVAANQPAAAAKRCKVRRLAPPVMVPAPFIVQCPKVCRKWAIVLIILADACPILRCSNCLHNPRQGQEQPTP